MLIRALSQGPMIDLIKWIEVGNWQELLNFSRIFDKKIELQNQAFYPCGLKKLIKLLTKSSTLD